MRASLLVLINMSLLIGIIFAWNEVSSDEFSSEESPQIHESPFPAEETTFLKEGNNVNPIPNNQEVKPLPDEKIRLERKGYSPNSKDHMKESKILIKIKSGKLIHQIQTEADSEGIYSKLSIYQTEMKYKNILVEEDFHKLSETDTAIRAIAMAADHLLIQVQPGGIDEDLKETLEDLDVQLEMTETPGLYRAQFDGRDPMKFYETQQALQEIPSLKFSEPDYVISLD